jgi:cytochrome c2
MGGAVLRRLQAYSVGLVAGLLASVSYSQQSDVARGEQVFQRCYSCHSVDPKETAALQGPTHCRSLAVPPTP